MAEDENRGQAQGEGPGPQDPEAGGGSPQDPEAGEGGAPQDPGKGEGAAVNRHKYDVDMRNKDRRIAELEKMLADRDSGAKTLEERLAAVEGELAESKRAAAEAATDSALAAAGCVDAKAAKARLGDFGGDVAKLRDACPYLFGAQAPRRPSSGSAPTGASSAAERVRAARAAAGLPEKKD